MFSGLVPLAVHNALESYEARRKELVDCQTERLREQTTLINGVMSSLNMPTALEDVSGNDVPASLLEKSKIVIGKGGAAPIDRLLTDLPDSVERNREILSKCLRILSEDQATDAELWEKFGAKWTRKPSAELTAPLRQKVSKYQTIIEFSQQANVIVRQKYHDSKRGIDLLSLPENELKKAVASASPIASLKNHEVVKELKMLCEKVMTLKAEREVIENELKKTSCDMSSKFTQVLSEKGALNEENISPAELDRIYQPLIEQVIESIGKQESLEANLQRASEQFSVLKQQGGWANTREQMLKEMAAAFDKYQELLADLQEGSKFYNDLTELLLKLQGMCSDLVFARKTEKEELLRRYCARNVTVAYGRYYDRAVMNDVIPKSSALSAIGKAQIAKATPYNPDENLSQKFSDMYSGLVPLAVHNALESYEARRKELVDCQTERLREQTTLINGVMSSLNMPAALEDVLGNDVPASLLEKSKIVIGKGGAAPIDRLLTDLPDSVERNREILSKCLRILSEDQATDAELREKFGAKWTRKPSAELTAPLRQEVSKYQTIIEYSQQANVIVRQKYHDSKRGIDLLSLPENELKKAVPSASPIASLKNHEVVKELKMLCEKVMTLKAEREVIENELKTTSCDMSGKFTQVLSEEGALNEENISPVELDRIYQPLIEQVIESIGKQESLEANLQRASEQFSVLNQQGGWANTREEMLKEMAAAFDKYQELLEHLQEGSKFYNDLTELLLKLQGKCSDLVFARKNEKEELRKSKHFFFPEIVERAAVSKPSEPSTSKVTPTDKTEVINNECVVCLDKLSDSVFLPCAHVCACCACADSLNKCPMCRKPITQKIKIFRS